jgi:Ca2+-dependent lipid-binding protein
MPSPEELRPSVEHGVETAKAAGEQLEALRNAEKTPEKSVESQEQSEAKAKHEALEQAVSVEAGSAEREKKQPSQSSGRRHGVISKKEKDKAFKNRMKQVQQELPVGSRAFSKLIHTKPIEKASDTLGSTIARPDAILSGAVAAFILVLLVYVIAKLFGYVLSGFETIGAFLIGWALGIVYDYLKIIITGKTS